MTPHSKFSLSSWSYRHGNVTIGMKATSLLNCWAASVAPAAAAAAVSDPHILIDRRTSESTVTDRRISISR